MFNVQFPLITVLFQQEMISTVHIVFDILINKGKKTFLNREEYHRIYLDRVYRLFVDVRL